MNHKIILASNSPRRKELLAGLDIPFEVKTIVGLDENFPSDLQAGDIPLFLSEKKSEAYESLWKEENTMVITSDTIVWVIAEDGKGQMLGKPKSYEEAFEMLQLLSGKTHQVFTGVCVRTNEKKESFVTRTNVKFSDLSDAEINYYIEKYKPYDKAGSYGVQEWIGYIAVEEITGSFYNVMGLPVHQLYKVLKSTFSSYIDPNRNC